jgi:endonuclease/exonuclease/phosphatase family metal-dependent hydrolase
MMAKHAHRFMGLLAGIATLATVVATGARMLPEDLQSLPYVPVLVSFTPWFIGVSVVALILALASRRWIIALMSIACLIVQVWWQFPFFQQSAALPSQAVQAVAASHADTHDSYARVMTLNVYKGHADPDAVVRLVRDERVEVLALQETTNAFVKALNQAGIQEYLPYSQVSSSDGVYGNGLWSATELGSPSDDDVQSSASFMPGGTVAFGGGASSVRFVSVHTTSPTAGYWNQWKRSLDELGLMRTHNAHRYVFMGDFNATMDHTPFRDFLGTRFTDATEQAGHGLTFTWPANRTNIPLLCDIDHIVMDKGIVAGQVQVVRVQGSDHAALLATIAV